MRIAIIGSGISGLAAGWYLSRKHEVSLFEKEPRLGGHTNTVIVENGGDPIPVDTGFIVHNDRTYPNLVKLLAELGVETQPSDMSFSVSCRQTGFEYSSRGINGFFAQRSNLLRREHYLLLAEILRFNRTAPKLLDQPGAESATIGDVIDEGRYHKVFTDRYLFPMASAVWSMSLDSIRSFPALTLLRFFHNHGMLGINTHPKWKVIRGGSHKYIPLLTAPFKERIFLDARIRIGEQAGKRCDLELRGSPRDGLSIRSCLPATATRCCRCWSSRPAQSATCWETSKPAATLQRCTRIHSLLPSRLAARASWNYNLGLTGNMRGRADLPHEPAAVAQDGRRLLRHAQRRRRDRRREGAAEDCLPSPALHARGDPRTETGGARSAAENGPTTAGRTGFTAFTRTD